MNEIINILGVFHDGSIVESRQNDSKISFRIAIEYLREMFDKNGNSIWIHLVDCDKVEFQPHRSSEIVVNLDEIAKAEPEILYVDEQDDIASVDCAEGTLRLRYKDIGFSLDTGEEISIKQLDNAAKNYWNNLK